MEFQRSPYVTAQHIAPEQPVPFAISITLRGWGWIAVTATLPLRTQFCRDPSHQNLHELPRADLDERSHACAGPL